MSQRSDDKFFTTEEQFGPEWHNRTAPDHSRKHGHYCWDWDSMWICEDCEEFQFCNCFKSENVMHYRNGREAKNGDEVVQLGTDDGKINAVGVLIRAVPGNSFCNGIIANDNTQSFVGACLCDCLHVDDVAAILKEKGLDKRTAGK